MSEFGIKIKNFQAGSIYGFNNGMRDAYDVKDAMLTNSLFTDFLLENGLEVTKGGFTRDVICIEFNYGTSDYETEIKKYNSKKKQVLESNSYTDNTKEKKIQILDYLSSRADDNKDNFEKKSKEELRTLFYTKGVTIKYNTYKKKRGGNNGYVSIIDEDNPLYIHYKRLGRTPGKAKKGSCMFIREELYDKAIDFLQMGYELPYENSPMVEMDAYASLTTSTIINKIQILPNEILVIKDVDSFFNTDVISIELDENKHCKAIPRSDYRLKNTLFDGQALIDESIFPDWADGYILLRHHLCKVASFKSRIQLFFRDYFGDRYETATVKDYWGNNVLAKDVKLITTENAMKWMKFDITWGYWCSKILENDSYFGIVKTAHESKLGNNYQRMSYQMINALEMNIMPDVMECSTNYIMSLKNNEDEYLKFLERNSTFSNDYEVLIALVNHNRDIINSDYYRERKAEILNKYLKDIKSGHVIQNADNLTIVGSPYAMLLHSVGEDPFKDDTFTVEENCTQCYTNRFEENKYLAEFRSPFNSKNNMGYLHNIRHEKLDRYFDFGNLIIAVNMIGTDFQDRNNGSDMDSDSIYTTDHHAIVKCAKLCVENYPTIVNNIPKQKNIYNRTMENYALIDNKLSAAQRAIGESSNLAQLALTYTYNFKEQKYKDYVCILSVLA